jgi:hypothetical protein
VRGAICLVLLAGCGSVKNNPADAAIDTSDHDAATDAPSCQSKKLLMGGTDVTA